MTLELREMLSGGNRTSVGRAAEVIDLASESESALESIYDLFFDQDPVIVMRSSYVAMRIAEQNPQSVEPFKGFILKNLANFKQQEIRWHVPQLLMHVNLKPNETKLVYDTLMNWAETDSSKIVAYYCLPTAAKLAEPNEELLNDFVPRLRLLSQQGAKSVSNRCKKIAKQLSIQL